MYNGQFLERLSKAFTAVYPQWNAKRFKAIEGKLLKLEMKPRVVLVRDTLYSLLPQNYEEAVKVILKAVRKGGLKGFDLWPLTEFIQTYGLPCPVESLEALKELTVLFTSEWAVRPFIQKYPRATMAFLFECSLDPNEHVRRWATEGTRPRLPWGERLKDFVRDPHPTLKILNQLKFDPSLYVRKSVANHLNDITKDHPAYVIRLLQKWKKEAKGEDQKKVEWIIHRALRTLIKDGSPEALRLIGVVSPKVSVKKIRLKEKRLQVGETLSFEVEIWSLAKTAQKLVVDYIVHFVRANKTLTPKVFKLKTFELLGGDRVQIKKCHSLKKITTRKFYPGRHRVEIQINGVSFGGHDWMLI